MKNLLLPLALALTPIAALLAHAAPGDEQGQARKEMRAGNVLSLRDIESRVLPSMPGAQYLGPSYDADAMVYQLRFIKDGRVSDVYIDARSGQVISRH